MKTMQTHGATEQQEAKASPVGFFVSVEPTSFQVNILKQYRFSEEFKREYCKRLVEEYPNGRLISAAIRTIKKTTKQEVVNLDTHRELIEDMIYSRGVLGFYMFEYASYGLQGLSIEEKMEFLPEEARLVYYDKLNLKSDRALLNNKFATYQHIGYAFKRDMLELRDSSDKSAFLDYCKKHDTLLVKPRSGSLGKGIQVFSRKDYSSADALFTEIMTAYGVKTTNAIIVEEPIIQHPSFARIHPESVNTLRVFTYYNGESVSVVYAWLKAGTGSSIVDNGGAGGMLAAVDPDTGVVYTDARNEAAEHFTTHPDTGFVFKGWKIEQWDEIVESVKEWAKDFPGLRFIGWDVAVSADRGVQLVEGNHQGMQSLIQIPTQAGIYREFLEKVEWEKYK